MRLGKKRDFIRTTTIVSKGKEEKERHPKSKKETTVENIQQ